MASNKNKNKRKRERAKASKQAPRVIRENADRFPFVVAYAKDKGRHLRAKRDLTPGDVVVEETPYVIVPKTGALSTSCHVCFRPLPENPTGQHLPAHNRCPKCEVAHFCSQECAERGALIHDIECSILNRVRCLAVRHEADFSLCWLILRIYIRRYLDMQGSGEPEAPRCEYDDVNLLVSNIEATKPAFLRSLRGALGAIKAHIQEACAPLPAPAEGETQGTEAQEGQEASEQERSPHHSALQDVFRDLNVDDAVTHACRITSNSFGVADAFNGNVAVSIVPICSMLCHSCMPNCVWVWTGRSVQVRALRPIPANEEISISYIDLYQPTASRRRELQQTKFFHCQCPRCTDPEWAARDAPMDGYRCPRCSDGCLVPIEPEPTSAAPATTTTTAATTATPAVEGETPPSEAPQYPPLRCRGCGTVVDDSRLFFQAKAIATQCSQKARLALICQDIDGFFRAVVPLLDHSKAPKLRLRANKPQGQGQGEDTSDASHDLAIDKDGEVELASSLAGLNLLENLPLVPGHYMHPRHHLLLNVRVMAMNACNQISDYTQASSHTKEILRSLESVLPPNHPEVANFEYTLAKQSLLGARAPSIRHVSTKRKILEQGLHAAQRCLSIRTVSCGMNHSLTWEARDQMQEFIAALRSL